ncbi:MAG: prolipoprotein diacylglyceryl transferase [Clostridia bacterium]|nr:prolipoprotein diacylglyceryl transferase [Clostridia bacterium]
MKTHFSFPGIGIGTHLLNQTAFTLFGVIEVRWSGIVTLCGILLSLLCAALFCKYRERIGGGAVLDACLAAILSGFVGARALYVLLTLETGAYKDFWSVIGIPHGGTSVWGALLGGAIGIAVTARIKRVPWKRLFDAAAPASLLAQAVCAWRVLFNGAVPGAFIGNETAFDLLGWHLTLPSGEGTLFHALRMGLEKYGVFAYYHPAFLYECVWCLVGFIVLCILYKHKKFNGQVALTALSWYGLGSLWIDGFRADVTYIGGTSVRFSQCVGLFCAVAATVALVLLCRRYAENDPFARPVPPHPDDTQWKNKEDNALSRAFERALSRRKTNHEEKTKHGNKN